MQQQSSPQLGQLVTSQHQMPPPAAFHQPMEQHQVVLQPVLTQPPPQLHQPTSQHLSTLAPADQPIDQPGRGLANHLMQLAGYGQQATHGHQEEQSDDEVVEIPHQGPFAHGPVVRGHQSRGTPARGYVGRGHHGGMNSRGRATGPYPPTRKWEDKRKRQAAFSPQQHAAPVGAAEAATSAAPVADPTVRAGQMVFRPVTRPIVTANMLPDSSWSLGEKTVSYHGGSQRVDFTRNLPREDMNIDRKFVWPTRKILVVDNVERPELPVPSLDGHDDLKKHPHLHLKPIVGRCRHHESGECSCIRQTARGQYHRNAVVPDVCLKNGLLKTEDLLVKPQGFSTQENCSHFYVSDAGINDHVLGIPSPYLINGQWPSKAYEPVQATGPMDKQSALYYALYNAERAQKNALLFQSPPTEWALERSPYFGEPSLETELGRVSKHLYGLETLPRVSYPGHPNAEPRAMLYVAMDWRDCVTPVYGLNLERPLDLDRALADVLRPWYLNGLGQIVCPVCLIETGQNGQVTLSKFSRTRFAEHWVAHHQQALMAISLFSGTQLNTRVHQGHMAYILALAHLGEKDSPYGKAICQVALEKHEINECDTTLKDFIGPFSEAHQEALLLEDEDMDYGPLANEALGMRAGPSNDRASKKAQNRAKK